jgi:hypothetical protein
MNKRTIIVSLLLAGPVFVGAAVYSLSAIGSDETREQARITLASHETPLPAPSVVPAALPAPVASGAPLTARIMAPSDAVRGDLVPLQLITTGDVTAVKWQLSPAVPGLVTLDSGRSAVFSQREPGIYRVLVAVAGPSSVELAEHELELVDGVNTASQPSANRRPAHQPTPAEEDCPIERTIQALPLDAALLAQVNQAATRNRSTEARILGSCYRSTASRLQSGLFPEGGDPFADVEKQAVLALGNAAPAWTGTMQAVKQHGQQLQADGLCVDAAGFAAMFSEVAGILARIQ